MSPHVGAALGFDTEDVVDALCDVFMSPEFAETLRAVHANKRRPIALRLPEIAYGDEETDPAGYPCVELIASDGRRQGNDSPMIDHEISAQWTVNGDHEDTMQRELKRLIQATRVHCEGMSLQPWVGNSPVRTGNHDFGPMAIARPRKEGVPAGYLKSGSIQLFYVAAFVRQQG